MSPQETGSKKQRQEEVGACAEKEGVLPLKNVSLIPPVGDGWVEKGTTSYCKLFALLRVCYLYAIQQPCKVRIIV